MSSVSLQYPSLFAQLIMIRLLLTLVVGAMVELGVAAAMGFKSLRELSAVAWANVITIPSIVWLATVVYSLLCVTADGQKDSGPHLVEYLAIIFSIQVAAVALEVLLLKWATVRSMKEVLVVSVAMNGASTLAGCILWAFLHILITRSVGTLYIG